VSIFAPETCSKKRLVYLAQALALLMVVLSGGCATVVSNAAKPLAQNLSKAIRNQDDPETVRDGAPAYLLMMDSFVEGSPGDAGMLASAAELYAAYGIVFVDDPDRAKRLTNRSRKYARQAVCALNPSMCEVWNAPYETFEQGLENIRPSEKGALFTLGLSWLAYIQAHRADWSALAELPMAEASLLRVQALDENYRAAEVEHYLGVLNTLRPPALGGQFDKGRAHYERAIELTHGLDLSIKVDYARYYARTLYDRDLHDRLLQEVLETDPVQPGMTLFNTLAQRDARILLESAEDYF
jgi:hypothetical protein